MISGTDPRDGAKPEESADQDAADKETQGDICPLCDQDACVTHCLGFFDASFADQGQGEYGIGLTAGALEKVAQIGELLELTRLAWISAARSAPPVLQRQRRGRQTRVVPVSPTLSAGALRSPEWMTSVPGLQAYFATLASGCGFDVSRYEDDDEALSELQRHTASHAQCARQVVQKLLLTCGWQHRETQWTIDVPMFSTTYIAWWDPDPEARADSLRLLVNGLMEKARSATAR